MPDRSPLHDGTTDADEALRRHHAELEGAAAPDPAFHDDLLATLEQAARRRGPSNGVLGAIGLAAGLAGLAVLGVTLALLRPPAPDPAASGTPLATDPVAVATDLPTDAPEPVSTPAPVPSPSATLTPAPTSTEASTSPPPTAAHEPSPTAAPTAQPTAVPATGTPRVSLPTPRPPDIAGTWRELPPLVGPEGFVSDMALGTDGRLYVTFFGGDTHPLFSFDASSNQWTELPGPAEANTFDSSLVPLPDGRLLHLVINPTGSTTTEAYMFAPQAGQWQEPNPRYLRDVSIGDGAILPPPRYDRKLYFVRNDDGRGASQTAAIDLETWTVTALADAPGNYGPAIAAAGDGRLYVTGEDGFASYDPASDTWRIEPDAPASPSGQAQFTAGGLENTDDPNLRPFGGAIYAAPRYFSGGVLVFDPARRSWLTASSNGMPPDVGLAPAPGGRMYGLDLSVHQAGPRRFVIFEPDR